MENNLTQRAQAIRDSLTIKQKLALLSGKNQWETEPFGALPSIWMADGPYGLRKEIEGKTLISHPATCFPTSSAQAATWNPALIQRMGEAIGREAQAANVHAVLGPGVNMKRSPLGGRNFEYFSEDPVLAAEMGSAFVDGVQGEGVGTSLKHFAANNQEYERMSNSSEVDERTLHEIYLRAFQKVVQRSHPWSVMVSYNKLNGVFAARNKWLLTDVLRGDWGYNGIVISDWGAAAIDRPATIRAGVHLEMPGKTRQGVEELQRALENGEITEAQVDVLIQELIESILSVAELHRADSTYDVDTHHTLAKEVAGEAITLLKNEKATLPLKKGLKVAVIGRFAKEPRYRGAGSSQVAPAKLDTAYKALSASDHARDLLYEPGYTAEGDTTPALLRSAREVAKEADVSVIFVGLPPSYESEGADRATIDLPEGHQKLINEVAQVSIRTVVVLTNGSAVAMPWLSGVEAVVEGWLAGQAGGSALADVLTGNINPSGRLSETFPVRIEDTPAYPNFPGKAGRSLYGEGIYIGYRHYGTKGIQPLFPFGFGLSYTAFSYGKLNLSGDAITDDETITASITVANTGNRAGKEVVQLYIGNDTQYEHHPVRELKAFQKVALEAGESTEVLFTIDRTTFEYWSERYEAWHTDDGAYTVYVGASVEDVRARAVVQYASTRKIAKKITELSLVKDLADHPRGKKFYNLVMKIVKARVETKGMSATDAAEAQAIAATEALMLESLPLAALPKMSEGILTNEFVDAVVSYCRHETGVHPLDAIPLAGATVGLVLNAIKGRPSYE